MREALKQGLLRCLEALRNDTDSDRLIETFLHRVRSGHARPAGVFRSDVRASGLQTRLATPQADRYRMVMENGSAILEFEGRKFVLPERIRATVNEMCRRTTFRPGELAGPLDSDGKLTLARYLHGERFLSLVD